VGNGHGLNCPGGGGGISAPGVGEKFRGTKSDLLSGDEKTTSQKGPISKPGGVGWSRPGLEKENPNSNTYAEKKTNLHFPGFGVGPANPSVKGKNHQCRVRP